MGHIIIDPRHYPGEPWLRRLIQELMRRAGGERLDIICGRDAGGPFCSVYRVWAEGATDEELALLWQKVREEHRSSVRWGAGERKKRWRRE